MYVTNQLSERWAYIVLLNQSYDGNRAESEVVFPGDKGRIETVSTEDQVVDLLLRESRCPVWIDISVVGADSEVTLFKLSCAGRYQEDAAQLYYYKQGTQPFGIKFDLPYDYLEGEKFLLNSTADTVERIKTGGVYRIKKRSVKSRLAAFALEVKRYGIAKKLW